MNTIIVTPDPSPLPPVAERSEFDGLGLIDGKPLDEFDMIASLLSEICERPTSFVSFIADDTQWFKATCGMDQTSNPLSESVCAHVFNGPDLVEIEDLALDMRTAHLSPVTEWKMRFYAGVPMYSPDGKLMGAVCVLDDKPGKLTQLQRHTLYVMAKQVQNAIELRKSLHLAETLRQEVDHRVKNSLQSISALTRIQARSAKQPETRAALQKVQSRIEMVAALHQQLYQSSAVNTVDLADFGAKVARILQHTCPEHVKVVAKFTPVDVTSQEASALGVVLNEFVANSSKHAFPDPQKPGKISLTGDLEDDGTLVVTLRDDGIGMPEHVEHHGLGFQVIEASVSQLAGEMQVLDLDQGYGVRLRIPRR
ncbi:putative sensor histidine kinase pdtaS [Aquimixticola soesokkakensis]|uniref:Putative sensor histidine kinase pdtaS n=1 Tax=Aquimixticola soesokkakensis TaxID=1519096 RepID=A0A1Y5SS50_9RHOB|nr:histidine kinase dimerization/phosphoacceptor domain -containing protein [Aquimixticola soesokkakensis]SLN46503.1 putative sensor histidine kinase pdtaS [Aquimixticola soesokkakensis]